MSSSSFDGSAATPEPFGYLAELARHAEAAVKALQAIGKTGVTGGLRQAEAVARAARAMGGMEMTGAARQAEAVSKAVEALGKDGMAELRKEAERFAAEAKALHERYLMFLGDGPGPV
jgi:hypothetical protein